MGVSLALTRAGAASSKWKPSVVTRAMTSAVTPPQGNDSPTAKSRPVLATEASTVAVSSGFTVRRSTTSISNPSFAISSAALKDSCNIGPPVMRAGVVENLIQGDAGKIGELHFHNWAHTFERSADGRADHGIFANRRV